MRSNGISHCKNGKQTPKPIPLARRGPHVIQQSLGPPHVPPYTAAPTVEALSHTYARRKVPIGYNGAPQMRPQKYRLPWTDPQTLLPASSPNLSDLLCQTAFGSDPPFFHNALDRPTHRRTYGLPHRQTAPTDKSSTGKFDDYRPLRSESDAAK